MKGDLMNDKRKQRFINLFDVKEGLFDQIERQRKTYFGKEEYDVLDDYLQYCKEQQEKGQLAEEDKAYLAKILEYLQDYYMEEEDFEKKIKENFNL